VFTGLFAFWLMRERFEPGWRVATLLAVAGCTCILLPGRFSGSEVDTLGVLLTLTAGFCYGLYTVTLKRLIADDAPLLAGLTATLAVGSVVLSLFAVPYLATHPGSASPLVGAAGFVLVAWLGIVTTAVAYLLFISGLHRVPAASVGTLALAEPLVAALLGLSLIGERPGAMTAVGGVLLLGGLVILTVRTPARTAQPTD
jgi:DME family drug/metabolite transporter